jgi:DNA topoisomerase-1
MVPTPVAYEVVDMLVQCFSDVMDVGFTAEMETKLDDIEEGGVDWHKVIADFYPGFERNLRGAASYGDELTENVCGKCGHFMIRRTGKFGKYLACSNYPECHNILSDAEEEISAVKCPKCGEHMVVRRGKFGKFLACPNYPNCKSTLPMVDETEVKMVGKCPECGNAMTERKSKKGKVYYSCSMFRECKFMSWDIPTGDRCEKCGSPMVKTARGIVKCSNKDCSDKERAETKETKGKAAAKSSAKTAKTSKKIEMAEDFEAPPLMDEPQYFGYEDIGNE